MAGDRLGELDGPPCAHKPGIVISASARPFEDHQAWAHSVLPSSSRIAYQTSKALSTMFAA